MSKVLVIVGSSCLNQGIFYLYGSLPSRLIPGFQGDTACGRILKDNDGRFLFLESQLLCAHLIARGVWLAVEYIFRRYEILGMRQLHDIKPALHKRPRARGDDRPWNEVFFEPVQQGSRAGYFNRVLSKLLWY